MNNATKEELNFILQKEGISNEKLRAEIVRKRILLEFWIKTKKKNLINKWSKQIMKNNPDLKQEHLKLFFEKFESIERKLEELTKQRKERERQNQKKKGNDFFGTGRGNSADPNLLGYFKKFGVDENFSINFLKKFNFQMGTFKSSDMAEVREEVMKTMVTESNVHKEEGLRIIENMNMVEMLHLLANRGPPKNIMTGYLEEQEKLVANLLQVCKNHLGWNLSIQDLLNCLEDEDKYIGYFSQFKVKRPIGEIKKDLLELQKRLKDELGMRKSIEWGSSGIWKRYQLVSNGGMFKNYTLGNPVPLLSENSWTECFVCPVVKTSSSATCQTINLDFESDDFRRKFNQEVFREGFTEDSFDDPSFLHCKGIVHQGALSEEVKLELEGKRKNKGRRVTSPNWYFLQGLETLQLDKNSLVMKDSLINQLNFLYKNLSPEKEKIFERCLLDLEKKVCLINLGHFEIGGIYSTSAHVPKTTREDPTEIKLVTKGKLNLMTKLGHLLSIQNTENFELEPKRSYLRTTHDELFRRKKLFEMVEISESNSLESNSFGTWSTKGSKLRVFQERVGGKGEPLIVTMKKFRPCYVAELLSIGINKRRIKHKLRIDDKELARLKNKMFKSFKQRYQEAVFVDTFELDTYFVEVQKQELQVEFSKKFDQIQKQNKETSSLLRKLESFKDELKSDADKKLWSSVVVRKSCKNYITDLLDQNRSLTNFDNNLNEHKRVEKLMRTFFKYWYRYSKQVRNNRRHEYLESNKIKNDYKKLKEEFKKLKLRICQWEKKKQNVRFDIGEMDTDPNKKLNLEKLEFCFTRFIRFCKNNEIKEIRKQFNAVLQKISKIEEERSGLPHKKMTLLFCLLKSFDLSIENLQIMQDIDITDIQSFLEFYKDNKETLNTIFQNPKRKNKKTYFDSLGNSKQKASANEEMIMLVNEHLAPANQNQTPWNCMTKAASFMIYIFQIKGYELEYTDLEPFFNGDEKHSELNTDLIKKLITVLKPFKEFNPKNTWNRLRVGSRAMDLQTSSTRSTATSFCFEPKLTLKDGLKINFNKNKIRYNPSPKELSKHVFDLLLNKELKFDSQSKPEYVVHLLSIYYLATDNLRRLLVPNIHHCGISIPFLYPDGECFLGPLSSLKLEFSDSSNNVKSLNPLFHPSFRFSFFEESDSNASSNLSNVPRELFENLESSLFGNGTGKFLDESTTMVHPITNRTSEEIKDFADLSLLFFQKKKIKEIKSGSNEAFIMGISNCIILLRAQETETTHKIRRDVAKYNRKLKDGDLPKLLVEVVKENIKLDDEEGDDFRLVIKEESLKNDKEYKENIFDFIRQYYELHQEKLKSLEKIGEESQPTRVKLDIIRGELSNVWRRAREMWRELKNQKEERLVLQGRYHQAYSENEEQRRKLVIRSDPRKKNEFFLHAKEKIKDLQMQYILEIGDKPVMLFLRHLFELGRTERLAYLFYLEMKLSEQPIMKAHTTNVKERVEVINLFREVEQIFEICTEFVKETQEMFKRSGGGSKEKSSLDEIRENLEALPGVMMELVGNSYPLEIFNGELSKVPIRWVLKTLELLKKSKSQETRFTVMSVVGMQSTGKSTLLNNLFNLNLKVGNDQCTKGSSMVMIPVEKSRYNKNDPDYLLLIDTEGLGSTETYLKMQMTKDSDTYYMRDNKMVTLNAGLSQLCVINSFQNFSKKMNDVMSIMINSIMTLKDCKIEPTMNLVFNGVDDTPGKVAQLKRESIDLMEKEFENIRRIKIKEIKVKIEKEIKSRKNQIKREITELKKNNKIDNRKRQNRIEELERENLKKSEMKTNDPRLSILEKIKFENVLRFVEKKQISLISPFGNNYRRSIGKYKGVLYSKNMLMYPNKQIHLESFRQQLSSLNNVLLYQGYLFDAKNFNQLHQKQKFMEMLIRLKNHIIEIAKKRILQEGVEDKTRFIQEYINDVEERIENSIRTQNQNDFIKINLNSTQNPSKGDYLKISKDITSLQISQMMMEAEESLIIHYKGSSKIQQFKKMQSKTTLQKREQEILNEVEKFCGKMNPTTKKFKQFIEETLKNHKTFFQNINKAYRKELKEMFNSHKEIEGLIVKIRKGPFNFILNKMNFFGSATLISDLMGRNSEDFLTSINLDKQKKAELQGDVQEDLRGEKFVFKSFDSSLKFTLISDPLHDFYEELENELGRNSSETNETKSEKIIKVEKSIVYKLIFGLKTFDTNWNNKLAKLCEGAKLVEDFEERCKKMIQWKFPQYVNWKEEIQKVIVRKIQKTLVDEFSEKANGLFREKINKMYYSYDKNELVYKCQKEMVREFMSLRTHEQKVEFVEKLIDFGKDPRSRVRNWISRRIEEIADNTKKENKLYQNLGIVLQERLEEVKDIIKTSKTFVSLKEELGTKFGISLDRLKIKESDHSSVMQSLEDLNFDIKGILDEIYMNVEVSDEEVEKKIKQYQKGTTFCMKRCFVCGAPCLKNEDHDFLENDPKHETNFHIPTMFLNQSKSEEEYEHELLNYQCEKIFHEDQKKRMLRYLYRDLEAFQRNWNVLFTIEPDIYSEKESWQVKKIEEETFTKETLFWQFMAFNNREVLLRMFNKDELDPEEFNFEKNGVTYGVDFANWKLRNKTVHDLLAILN